MSLNQGVQRPAAVRKSRWGARKPNSAAPPPQVEQPAKVQPSLTTKAFSAAVPSSHLGACASGLSRFQALQVEEAVAVVKATTLSPSQPSIERQAQA